jgi:hypothetical protein
MTNRWKNILGWTIYAIVGAVVFGFLGVTDHVGFWFGVGMVLVVDVVALILGTALWLVIQ